MTREQRFTHLYRTHLETVRAYAWRRGPQTADDVVADTFLVAWRRLDEVPPDNPVPWLIGVARNVRLNALRGERRRSALHARLAPGAPAPSAAMPDGRLGAALGSLPELDRELLLLDAWDGLDNAAIARVLGCPRATVAVRKSRARRRLAAALHRQEQVPAHHDLATTGGMADGR